MVAIVKAAKKAGRVYKTDEGRPTWPVCHVLDTTALYFQILKRILEGKNIAHGRNGYYFAASGSVAWEDIYSAMAEALKKRGVVEDANVTMADSQALKLMGEGIGCPVEIVPVQLGGL